MFVVDLIRDVLPSATTWWDIRQLGKKQKQKQKKCMQRCSSDEFLRVALTLQLPGDQNDQCGTSYTVSHSGSH